MFFSGKTTTAKGKLELKLQPFDDVVFEQTEYREYRGDRGGIDTELVIA